MSWQHRAAEEAAERKLQDRLERALADLEHLPAMLKQTYDCDLEKVQLKYRVYDWLVFITAFKGDIPMIAFEASDTLTGALRKVSAKAATGQLRLKVDEKRQQWLGRSEEAR